MTLDEPERLPANHMFAGLRRNGYATLYLDPPWRFNVRSDKGTGRSADRHYPTMTLADIEKMPVGDLAAKDCHLWLWITGPMLAIGAHLPLLKAWGFKPSSMGFVWMKTNSPKTVEQAQSWDEIFFMGQGFTTRQNAEYCILARRGSPPRQVRTMRQLVIAPRREHSRKPDEMYAKLEAYGRGPFLEMFSRTTAPGWDVWGKDRDLFQFEALKAA